MLAELMRLKFSLAVAGSHGKTTTSSLLTTVLKRAGLDPTAVIGGKLAELGSNARLGQSDYLVAEADESDGSFLQLLPSVAVITNIDPEHIDHYGSVAALEAAFVDFANKVPFYGRAVLCIDHPVLRRLLPQIHKRYVTYGLSPDADYRATAIRAQGLLTRFTAWRRDGLLGEVTVRMPGVHSAVNALSVLAVCDFLGVPFSTYQDALADFQGVGRRFTVRGQVPGLPAAVSPAPRSPSAAEPAAVDEVAADSVLVVDDYGHHPAEIRATLQAARAGFPGRRILVAFQPHRYTRTRDLFDEFAGAFGDAAAVFVTDIYAASEPPIPGIGSQGLVARIRECGHPEARYVASRHELPALFARLARPGDLILTLGAGDISASADDILHALRSR
jgi:UDP-N-acetylmuramate--alanine ligase